MTRLTVLGICGSPRPGNSEFLLDKALDAAHEVDPVAVECLRYTVRGKKMAPCLSCFRCGELGGECVIKDSFQEARDLWLRADVVIYSVPVYHMGLPGQLKCFIDRLGNSLFGRYRHLFPPGVDSLPRHLKVIAGIAQGVHLCSGQEHALTDIVNHALLMQCVPVTGDMWESYIGAAGWTANDIERAALSKQFEEGRQNAELLVKAARDVGRRATETALVLRAGVLARESLLKTDPTYLPLLERVRVAEVSR
ncbi:MAG: flavodoxin family protein [Bacillota bacterium]|nr:MAG: flavodoxin family protein [Bacillota bacterium]